MIAIRKASDRGHANHGWLDSHHTFSFAGYHDPAEMGFGSLRVINEDRVAPGMGFGTHPHRDSMGTGSVIRPGDVQRLSAGTGVTHSEFNGSKSDQVHFLQIWIEPKSNGIAPSYEQKNFSVADKKGRLRLVASPDGAEGSVTIHQDAWVYATVLDGADFVTQRVGAAHRVYVHVARGEVEVNGKRLVAGDGLKIVAESEITMSRGVDAEVLLFDMAA